jgi:hypothetical protein
MDEERWLTIEPYLDSYGFKMSTDVPVTVRAVSAGGAAERAGLCVNDTLRTINGVPVDDLPQSSINALLRKAHGKVLIVVSSLVPAGGNGGEGEGGAGAQMPPLKGTEYLVGAQRPRSDSNGSNHSDSCNHSGSGDAGARRQSNTENSSVVAAAAAAAVLPCSDALSSHQAPQLSDDRPPGLSPLHNSVSNNRPKLSTTVSALPTPPRITTASPLVSFAFVLCCFLRLIFFLSLSLSLFRLQSRATGKPVTTAWGASPMRSIAQSPRSRIPVLVSPKGFASSPVSAKQSKLVPRPPAEGIAVVVTQDGCIRGDSSAAPEAPSLEPPHKEPDTPTLDLAATDSSGALVAVSERATSNEPVVTVVVTTAEAADALVPTSGNSSAAAVVDDAVADVAESTTATETPEPPTDMATAATYVEVVLVSPAKNNTDAIEAAAVAAAAASTEPPTTDVAGTTATEANDNDAFVDVSPSAASVTLSDLEFVQKVQALGGFVTIDRATLVIQKDSEQTISPGFSIGSGSV